MKRNHNCWSRRAASAAGLLATLLLVAPCHAQTSHPAPVLTLSVNNEVAPRVAQGWPIVIELEVCNPNVAQMNGNAIPITLNLPSGSWADGIQLYVLDASGNMQTWPLALALRPTADQSSITLGVGNEGRLAWSLQGSSTAEIAAGAYTIAAVLNASTATASGAFNGIAASNPVTITIGPEPSPMTNSNLEQKYTVFATYDVLRGNLTQATTDINTLLTNVPHRRCRTTIRRSPPSCLPTRVRLSHPLA
jgi:hypothetical protein